MQYVSLIQMYVGFIVNAILFFSHGLITYKEFSFYFAFVSAFFILYYFFFLIKQKIRLIKVFIGCLIFVLLYYYSSSYYAELSKWYNSYFLVLLGQSIPVVLTAVIVSEKSKIQENIKILTPYLALIFTFIAFDVTFNPKEAALGLSGDEEANLNYQATSYMAAYASAFAGYYLINKNKIHWHIFFRFSVWKYVMSLLILLNFVIILMTGGRGGLVVFVIQFLFFLFLLKSIYRHPFFSIKTIVIIVLIGIGFYYGFNFVLSSNLESSGFERFFDLAQEESVIERSVIMKKAIDAFFESPIIGHGIGAVLNEVGIYSHNIFMDFLVDTGVIGCFFVLVFIVWIFYKGFCLIRLDSSNCLWLIVFLDGFIMSQFSAYYLSSFPMLWVAAFIASYSLDNFQPLTILHNKRSSLSF